MRLNEEKYRRKIEKIIHDSGWIKGESNTTVQGMAEQIYANCITGAFVNLYERMDWFLKWLVSAEPEATTGWIVNEWLRSDPSCTGTRMRKLLE